MPWYAWTIVGMIGLESVSILYWSCIGHVRQYGFVDSVINLTVAPLVIWAIVSLANH